MNEPRSYDPGRAIWQSASMPGYVDVTSQLLYMKHCLSLSCGMHQLEKRQMKEIIAALEQYEDDGKTVITVDEYKKLKRAAKDIQNLAITSHHLQDRIAEQTAQLDAIAKREHELGLARLNYHK